ncbi:hypothetical protein L596_029230 [Steinernema carpocapsae]|uniref:Uncharacterized protein n=1 Tax=Steinernema carpocapsae TaxID=34508 RepID=A0A4U5LU10_STECR|nr:hypothetical protein L596_029230 [Steinernema carpocapsae]
MDGVMDRSFDSMSSFNFSIASTGEMPPVSGQLQRLLCACYHPDKAGPRAKDEDAYAKIVKKKPDESKPGKHENSEKHVPTEVEVDEVGYAKLSIIRTPSQEAQFTSEYENNKSAKLGVCSILSIWIEEFVCFFKSDIRQAGLF